MIRIRKPIAAAVAGVLLASAVPAVAGAQGTSQPGANGAGVEQARVSIDNCVVKRSRNAGGFTYFYCNVVVDPSVPGSGSVQYSVNQPIFKPRSGGTWSKATGTLNLQAGEIESLKFATHRSVSQVKANLKVTLSNANNLAIADGTAVAANMLGATGGSGS
jgi:hypothetical protein